MKDSHHGEHRPGLHRTGESEPTDADFEALKARVKALEDAAPATGGGKKYVLCWADGLDASAGDASTGSQGGVPAGTWNVISVQRFRKSDGFDGLSSPANETEFLGGVNIFVNPIVSAHGGALTFRQSIGELPIDPDYTPFFFVVLLESSDP